MNMTRRQRVAYDAIAAFIAEHRISPTYVELGKILGVSYISAMEHCLALERKGFLVRRKRETRSIELIPETVEKKPKDVPVENQVCPFCGRIKG